MFSLVPWRKRRNEESRSLAPRGRHPLAQLREEFDQLFDRFLSEWPAPLGSELGLDRPWGLDVEDREQEVVVQAELPGFEAGDLDVQVSGNVLTIRAERKHESQEGKGNGRHQERGYSRVFRTVTLPAGIDRDKVEARYRNGVLEVHVPKTETARGKRIPVQA